jgi:serine/threonine protein kinase
MYPAVAAGRSGPCPKCRQQTPFGPAAARPVPAGLEATAAPAPIAPSTPAAPSSPALRAGVLLAGRFELADELGRGAFGVVYRAHDVKLNRKEVAVKVLLDRALSEPEAVKRFRSEAVLLCGVNHAHVPAVLDMGEYAGQQYIVSEFVDGRTVRELIPEGGFENPADAVRLVAKLARTLHDIYASKGILHRDVKPSNMMVPSGQADGLYLMDFGLAVCHDADGERTREGTTLGTPLYMSPEQADGRISAICHASDIYSAGVVLYHLLTGRPPFVSGWPMIAADHLLTPPEPPSVYRPGLDAELDAIVLKALEKRAADRYATGAEFAQALELWAARQLVGVSGRGPVYPRRRAYPSGPASGSVRRPAGDQSSVANRAGETLTNSRSQPGGTVVIVTPVSKTPWGKIAAGVGVLLLVAAVAAVALKPGKTEPTAAPPPPPVPDPVMKEWKRG